MLPKIMKHVNTETQHGTSHSTTLTLPQVDSCHSCEIGVCNACPIGRYRAEPGAVDESECLKCPKGLFSNSTGAAECNSCPPGSYVTDDYDDMDGIGTESGGLACVRCPRGRESKGSSSTSCVECEAGDSSTAGQPCTAW